ncbi:SDR family oxidoreductase [Ornithinimicrobium cavernae]|uniref:SDR family oxidoreductase n=1 Tax=Ornithinimicrobium cavernae TaxID=2666047 RepID=UPI000D698159|nr:SDR family oxidoreductase [Ornithinimicrobium cavernae]
MTAPILVTGGTGLLGREVVPLLRAAGHPVRILSRSGGAPAEGVEHVTADLTTGEGVAEAAQDVHTVLHLAGLPKRDGEITRNLVEGLRGAAVEHLIHISVIGVDRVPVRSAIDRGAFGYFAGKAEAERAVEASGIPWTTLRAAQFHEFVQANFAAMARMPIVPAPSGMSAQPVATAEVAARLVELAEGEPAGLVEDLAGPEVLSFTDMLRGYLAATGRRRPVVGLRMPGAAAQAFREGANLAPDRAVGTQTWQQSLALLPAA